MCNSTLTALKVARRKTVLSFHTFSVQHLILFDSACAQLSESGIIKQFSAGPLDFGQRLHAV